MKNKPFNNRSSKPNLTKGKVPESTHKSADALSEVETSEKVLFRGVVTEVFPKFCNVLLDSDKRKLLCSYRRAKVIDKEAEWRERSPVAPGDIVGVHAYGTRDGVIESVEPRTNCIQRRAPGIEGKVVHTIAANVDLVVIVASLRDPDFSFGLIDRFLIAATRAGIKPILIINKVDLQENFEEKPWQLYLDLGVLCFPMSTRSGDGIQAVKEYVTGKTSVFAGHSGVGKTSLLQILFGEVFGRVGEISKRTGKGKHTTTVSKLLEMPDGTRFIDTPGIKEFGLFDIDPRDLVQYFAELFVLQEKHEEYSHLPRHESYLRIKEALEKEGR
jgi:ribosome biogenesis GTPase